MSKLIGYTFTAVTRARNTPFVWCKEFASLDAAITYASGELADLSQYHLEYIIIREGTHSSDDPIVWDSRKQPEVDPDHFCNKHQCATGEGDICGQCEAEFDNYRMLVNLEMSKHQYELWFVLSKQYSYRCPVSNFDEAKMLESSLSSGCTTGVRIARMSEEEGCEVVLHKFK